MKTSPVRPSAILLLAASIFTGWNGLAQEPRAPGNSSAESEKPASSEILPAQFQATFYEVQAASNLVSSLDAKSLAGQAATPEALLQALGKVGAARVLYRIGQPVNLFSERILLGSSAYEGCQQRWWIFLQFFLVRRSSRGAQRSEAEAGAQR